MSMMKIREELRKMQMKNRKKIKRKTLTIMRQWKS
jgi:hypothetical protein